ncbi:unnamed protein product [Brassica oleracea var. botrytis]|nr:unnamed protein product [Brassica oleracea]
MREITSPWLTLKKAKELAISPAQGQDKGIKVLVGAVTFCMIGLVKMCHCRHSRFLC